MQISSSVLAISLIMIIKRKPFNRVQQITAVFVGPIISAMVSIYKLSANGFSIQLRETLGHETNRNIATVTINMVALLVTSTSLLFIYR